MTSLRRARRSRPTCAGYWCDPWLNLFRRHQGDDSLEERDAEQHVLPDLGVQVCCSSAARIFSSVERTRSKLQWLLALVELPPKAPAAKGGSESNTVASQEKFVAANSKSLSGASSRRPKRLSFRRVAHLISFSLSAMVWYLLYWLGDKTIKL
jgi:hypothetical protein